MLGKMKFLCNLAILILCFSSNVILACRNIRNFLFAKFNDENNLFQTNFQGRLKLWCSINSNSVTIYCKQVITR